MERTAAPYVVIGGTGILAPLGALLAQPGARRIAVSRCRSPRHGEWDEFVCCDTTDPTSVTTLIGGLGEPTYDLIGYLPALTPETWTLLCGNAIRRVLIATSTYADPSNAGALTPWLEPGEVTTCTLGWRACRRDDSRWHTPDEIAAAALGALAAPPGARRTLGTLRPWSDRPT